MTEGIPPPNSSPNADEREAKRIEAERKAAARQIAEEAITQGKQREFLNYLNKFPDGIKFPKEVIPPLLEYIKSSGLMHLSWDIVDNLRLFDGLDNETAVALMRADAGFAQSYFDDKPPRSLLETRDRSTWRPAFSYFPPPSADVAQALLDANQPFVLFKNFDQFSPNDHPAIVESVWNKDQKYFREPWHGFPHGAVKKVSPEFTRMLLKENITEPVQVWIEDDLLSGEVLEEAIIAMVPEGALTDAHQLFRMANVVVKKGDEGKISPKIASSFVSQLFPRMRSLFLQKNEKSMYYPPYHTPMLIAFNRLLPAGERDTNLEELTEVFGSDGISSALYESYGLLKSNSYHGPLLGGPAEGTPMAILRREMNALRPAVNSGEPNYEILHSPLHRELFKTLVRFDQSSFGSHDSDALLEMADTYSALKAEGALEPLDSAYVPFELSVPLVREGKTVYTEDFLARFKLLTDDIRFAQNVVRGEKNPLSYFAARIKESQNQALFALDALVMQAKREGENPKKVEHLKKQVSLVESVNVRDMKSIEHTLTVLARVRQAPAIESLFRHVAFAYTLMRYPQEMTRDYALMGATDTPSRDDIAQVLEFIDHLTNDEVWKGKKEGTVRRPIIKSKNARAVLDQILETAALQEQYERFQMLATEDTKTIRVVPERNFNTELSGHMGDACWASKYKSIVKEFPNLTSLRFVQNPGGASERIAGAALVLDGMAKDGTPLMIVRGVNPIENVIQKLHAPTFMRSLLENLEAVAKARGRRLAVVVDDAGHASTNRPAVAEVLKHAIAPLPPDAMVALSDAPETTFNGYDLKGKTWYVDSKQIA